MALICLVWTDGAPAIGVEYGPGNKPVCCPECETCVDLIIEAQREGTVLGWLIFPCGDLLDTGRYAMDVTGTPDAVTVAFTARKTQETGAAVKIDKVPRQKTKENRS